MNIQQFKYVLAVVNSENFETAAEKCFVTQSTLSTMIGRLENEIGMKIFNRKTKPVSITSEGEEIIKRFEIINNELGELENLIQELKGEMVGEIKVGIIPTVAPFLLPLVLPQFAKTFPEVKIIVKEIPTKEIIHLLKNRSLDIGLLALPIIDKELVEEGIYIEPFHIYDCRIQKSDTKISIHDLDYSKLWLLQEGHCLRTQVHKICELSNASKENELNIEFESGSMDSLLRFTKANEGITILPHLTSLELSELDKKNIIEFREPIPSRSIGMLTHKYFAKKKLAKKLKEIISKATENVIPILEKTDIIRPI